MDETALTPITPGAFWGNESLCHREANVSSCSVLSTLAFLTTTRPISVQGAAQLVLKAANDHSGASIATFILVRWSSRY